VGASLRANTASDLQQIAAQISFRDVALLPGALLIVFGGIWLYDRLKTRRTAGIVAVGTRA
jgi:hypothetical protein